MRYTSFCYSRVTYRCECATNYGGKNCDVQVCRNFLSSQTEMQFITRGHKPGNIRGCSWTIRSPRHSFIQLFINIFDPLHFVTLTIESGTQFIKLTGNVHNYNIRSERNIVTISYVEAQDIPLVQLIVAYHTGKVLPTEGFPCRKCGTQ